MTRYWYLPSECSPEGNAFCILGMLSNAMEKCGYSKEEISAAQTDAMSSDYKHLRAVAQKWFIACNKIMQKQMKG